MFLISDSCEDIFKESPLSLSSSDWEGEEGRERIVCVAGCVVVEHVVVGVGIVMMVTFEGCFVEVDSVSGKM